MILFRQTGEPCSNWCQVHTFAANQGNSFKQARRGSASWSQASLAHNAPPLDTNYRCAEGWAGSYLLNWDCTTAPDTIRSAFKSFLLLVWFACLARLQREERTWFFVCFLFLSKKLQVKVAADLFWHLHRLELFLGLHDLDMTPYSVSQCIPKPFTDPNNSLCIHNSQNC